MDSSISLSNEAPELTSPRNVGAMGIAEPKALRPILILLIEDRLNDAKLFQKVLSTASDAGRYWLIHTKRLSSALTMLQKERVDVVVLDLSLPDSEGLGAIELIRQNAPMVPVIVLTGSAEPNYSSTSLKLGAQEFISKDNMSGESLSTSIQNSIDRHRHNSQLEMELSKERSSLEVDTETQLPTQRIFRIRLEYALEQARRESKILGLMLVRVHDFLLDGTSVPHSLRPSAWGFLANRLTHMLRKNDTIGRLDENTLALLCYDVHDILGVHRLASKIAKMLESPFEFQSDELKLSFNMGVASSPFDEATSSDLIAAAERALDYSAIQGKNQCSFASKLLNIQANEAAQQAIHIKSALSGNSFQLNTKKIISFDSKKLSGFRVQISSTEPALASMGHHEILDMCDLVGVRQEILKWMFKCIADVRSGLDRESSNGNTNFYIQLPSSYLFHIGLPTMLSSVVKDLGVKPENIVVEVNEDMAWARPDRASHLFESLFQLGFRFCVENLGAGHASLTQLAHLKRFSLGVVGLSTELIRESAKSPEKHHLLSALIDACHRLGLSVSAKDIRDANQIEVLKGLGCDWIEECEIRPSH